MQNYQYTGLENREVFWNAQNFQIPLDLLALVTICHPGLRPLSAFSDVEGDGQIRKCAMTTGEKELRIF